MDDLDVLDGLYEAAVLPELWPDAIDSCAQRVGGIGAVMFMTHTDRSRGFSSPGIAEAFKQWAAAGGLENNPRLERALILRDMPVVRDQDLFSPDEIESLPYFRTVRQYGLGWAVAFKQPMPDGSLTVLSLERPHMPFDEAAAQWLTRMKPHVARAAVTSMRLALDRIATTLSAFSAFGIPAATVGPAGRMIDANAPFSAFLASTIFDRRERLTLADKDADLLLAEALARLRRDLWSGTVGSIPLRPSAAHGPLVLHVVPIRRHAHDIFGSAGALLVVSVIGAGQTLETPMIQALFDLTPAEARVCRSIADGRSPAQTAAELGTTEQTVRTQLKTAFRKCGVHRQAELASLLRAPLSAAGR